MKNLVWHRWLGFVLAGAALLQETTVKASVIGSAVDNLDGTYTYSYRVDNSAGAFDIAGWSLEFLFASPDWNQLDVVSGGGVSTPNLGWLADVGIPTTGLSAQDFLSLTPATDVAVGTLLGDFSFVSKFAPGTITYHEFSALGDAANGTTLGPVAVPDAGGGMLAVGLISVFSLALRKGQSVKKISVD